MILPSAGAVHIWYLDAHTAPSSVDALTALLCDDERARMRRFHFEEHARRYAVRRGVLRRLLGDYLDIAPSDVKLSEGAQGKPTLAEEMNSAALRFNLSHSGDRVVYAFAAGTEIGVDIEQIKEIPEALQLAHHYFSQAETAWLAAQPAVTRPVDFLRCWTGKETVVKALGGGLSLPLQEFSVKHWEPRPTVEWPGRQEVDGRPIFLLDPPGGTIAALFGLGEIVEIEEKHVVLSD